MLNFAAQKKILDPILKNPKNHLCADCDSISPTWASLDFGVFLCSNCSGAHRGLGPTITRVRSATLDKWQEEWIDNMLIGNSQLNSYWQGDDRAFQRKPKIGSTLNEIGRYVFEKYIKKKFVKNRQQADPLTSYKNGTYSSSKKQQTSPPQQHPVKPKNIPPQPQPAKPAHKHPEPIKTNSFSGNLLQFDFNEQPAHQDVNPSKMNNVQGNGNHYGQHIANGFQSNNNHPQHKNQQYNNGNTVPNNHIANHDDDDDFTEFTEAGSTTDHKANDNFISFDALLGQQKKPQPAVVPSHSMPNPHMNLHHHNHYNPSIHQHGQSLPYHGQYHHMHSQHNHFQSNSNIMANYGGHHHSNYQQQMQGGYIGMPYQNHNPSLITLPNAYWK